ncbi:hypothetical protein [Roseibium salinum]|uniref:HdeA/HdeB family protein n=1 Tax=Roseibium salinum TaxID=1604349 RepID=A0ABT3R4F2_9HYPH|nr:hypothetical protein [Roseibium sp. DSM 29163]MCX2724080.1 hypothetical protein [Roseibium sp. DSM 29163]
MKRFLCALALLTLTVQGAGAADLYGGLCRLVQPSQLLTIDNNTQLSDEVVRMMTEAVNVADDDKWVASTSPTFTWASEAKAACGIAYGYLRTSTRDEDSLNRCECFHQRMVSYMY